MSDVQATRCGMEIVNQNPVFIPIANREPYCRHWQYDLLSMGIGGSGCADFVSRYVCYLKSLSICLLELTVYKLSDSRYLTAQIM
jgi:hypothetical protein